jgi:putative endonuclease
MQQAPLDKAWRRRKGGRFEQLALAWLQAQGLRLVQCNYHCKLGEIDLVMRDRELLVFVEVRFRGTNSQVSACETVDARKQQKLLRAARHFLLWNRQLAELPCRFDVLGISNAQGHTQYEWVRNAFC